MRQLRVGLISFLNEKGSILFKFKADENFNHRNTLQYFED